MTLRWSLTPVDSWFFREARSHDAVGVGQLNSVFPPPATTLAGAIRTAMGDHLGIDWHELDSTSPHHTLLGEGSNMGLLNIDAIQLCVSDEAVYPAPQDLLKSPEKQGGKLHRLKIGAPMRCDLGYVAMPEMDAPAGSKPVENSWISEAGLHKWLAGELPSIDDLVSQSELIIAEPRLGIGRDNTQGIVQQGLLYQTRHVRPTGQKMFSVDVYLQGIDDVLAKQLPEETSLRLGGEGREAAVKISRASRPEMKLVDKAVCAKARGVVLYLASPANFNHMQDADSVAEAPSWCLPGFDPVKNEQGEITHWQGKLAGVELKLISCTLPRAQRLGGWDQQLRKPKPLISLAAPGSIYYCEVMDTTNQPITPELLQTLQGEPVGIDTSLGYGRVLAGLWIDSAK